MYVNYYFRFSNRELSVFVLTTEYTRIIHQKMKMNITNPFPFLTHIHTHTHGFDQVEY